MRTNGLIWAGYKLIAVVATLLLPLLLLHPRGRVRILERYGHWKLSGKQLMWFHGASVGELNGLLPIINTYRRAHPSVEILITATSPTGLVHAESVAHYNRLLPVDATWCIKHALKGVSILGLVIAETEIWPNLQRILYSRNIPTVLVNARISDFTIKRYRWLGPLFTSSVQSFKEILATNDLARDRFIEFCANPNHIHVVGHAKYDRPRSVNDPNVAFALKQQLCPSRAPVLVLGSLRPGEEEVWFPPLASAVKAKALQIIVAPRHQEKFEYFAKALARAGLDFQRWSELGGQGGSASVTLLDTLGKLEQIYSFATAAFIGGSLIPGIGGHNPLEAAAYGAAITMGPYSENVTDVVADLKKYQAITIVHDAEEAAQFINQMDSPEIAVTGQQGQQVWRQYQGATDRICATLSQVFHQNRS